MCTFFFAFLCFPTAPISSSTHLVHWFHPRRILIGYEAFFESDSFEMIFHEEVNNATNSVSVKVFQRKFLAALTVSQHQNCDSESCR